MNKLLETVNSIRELFKMDPVKEEELFEEVITEDIVEEVETEIKLEQAVLVDGETILFWDGEIVEGTVLFTDEELTLVVEDGEYTFENGMVLTITEGVVSIMTMPEEVIEEEVVETPLEMDDELVKEVELLKSENEDLKSEIETIQKKEKFLLEKIEKIENQPAVEPITETIQEVTELSITERRMNALNSIKNIRI